MIYLDAVRRAGTADRAKVRDAIEQTRGLVLTAGEFNLSATDHTGLGANAYRMLQVRDGRLRFAD